MTCLSYHFHLGMMKGYSVKNFPNLVQFDRWPNRTGSFIPELFNKNTNTSTKKEKTKKLISLQIYIHSKILTR